MPFHSKHPDIHPPKNTPLYTYHFTSPHTSPLSLSPSPPKLGGYTNPLTHERLNFARVHSLATNISSMLVRKFGLREGETVAVVAGSSVWYPVGVWAGIRVGARIAGVSPAYNVEELRYALRTAEAKFVIAGRESLDVVVEAAREVGIPSERVFLLEGEKEKQGFKSLREISEIGEEYGEMGQVEEFRIPEGKTNADVCAFLCFSSGTTGLPKAVMISHHNIIAQIMQLRATNPRGPQTVLGVLPLYHVTGIVRFLNLPLSYNDEMLLLPTFTLPTMLSTIQSHSVHEIALVPPLVIRLLNDPLVGKYNLSSLRRLSSGAAPLSRELVRHLAEKFPWVKFRQGYGMTESTACITSHSAKYQRFDPEVSGTVGDLVPSTSIMIVDAEGKEVGFDEEGEILARGPQIAMGYLGNEEASQEAFLIGGWLRTGDVGFMNRMGLLSVTDRIKEMVKVKGIQVAPAEIEDVLLGHRDVVDVAVVGVQDGYAGERVKAFVVLREGVSAGEHVGRELMAYVRERKVRFKWVREIEFVDEVPKSASGKILRRVLREMEKGGQRGVVVRDEGERARL